LLGLGLALRARVRGLASIALAMVLLVGMAATARWGGLGPVVFFPERPLAVLAVVLCAGLAFLVQELLRGRRLLRYAAVLVLVGIAGERAHRYYWGGSANVMVGRDDLEAMRWIGAHTQPLDVVCNDYGTAGLWIPALAGRSISAPHLPPFYRDEFDAGSRGRPCAYTYISSRPFFVAPPPRDESAGRAVFRNETVTILKGGRGGMTSFDTARGNPDSRDP